MIGMTNKKSSKSHALQSNAA